ncbi:MAG: chromosomal replication initiator protein DnaA [Solibacterales bacterium]|nr:chromosomal replication initiator protein DnaA [Bryobacterales bacterium]|tara:strand:+ start:20791 stop:22113 length:1323 start_codon:yes stop_codon:yes gene_type:complete
MNAWQQILERLRSEISRENHKSWLSPVRFSHIDSEKTLHLVAPSDNACKWLAEEYQACILAAAKDLALFVDAVAFRPEKRSSRAASIRETSPQQARFNFTSADSLFNPKYTFEKFVVGSCNEFAHAAAQAVAANPARAYNPLYIYGGVGMGKTHLMHAIGGRLRRNWPDFRVVYVSSEQFMNEMVSSMRYNSMSSFHERFRSADALLIDDIQSLQGKDGTQEEFFHTFNALHNMQKQIVISCDRPPKLVSGLVDRLRSRFEWGLMTDIQPPDLETKMAILDRKAADSQAHMPDDVRSYLASQMRSNIRELEGALIRLAALSSLTGAEISLGMAREAIRSSGSSARTKVTLESIQRAVAEEFGMSIARLQAKSNARAVTLPRQVAMYLCKELTPASLPEIGRSLGGKHHTTVIHALTKIERRRQDDQELNRIIHKLTDRFD